MAILTEEEELCLVQFVKDLVKAGFPATDCDLFDQVQKLLLKDGRQNPFENSKPTSLGLSTLHEGNTKYKTEYANKKNMVFTMIRLKMPNVIFGVLS